MMPVERARSGIFSRAIEWEAALMLVLGMAAMAVRSPGPGALLVVCSVGVLGALAPIPQARTKASFSVWAPAVGLGVAAVLVVGRMGLPVTIRPNLAVIAGGLVAAVSEEAFFRRLLYGWLESRGPAVAVLLSALAFALVHLPLYGVAALPLNLAAGILFGWQRWATGTWSAPAITHSVANLIGMGVLG
jgi:membrane protease YdiL (CAAX protease family)